MPKKLAKTGKYAEHAVHADFFRAHMVTKGQELAHACLAIIDGLANVA